MSHATAEFRFPMRTRDGIDLLGEVWGSGPLPLTFVHGSGLTVQTYRPAFSQLATRSTVYAINSRGHGGSPLPPTELPGPASAPAPLETSAGMSTEAQGNGVLHSRQDGRQDARQDARRDIYDAGEARAAFWEPPLADLADLAQAVSCETAKRASRGTDSPGVVLAGHSFGAMLSLRLAAQQPHWLAGLILLDPLVPWPRGGVWVPVGKGADGGLIAHTRTRRSHWESRAEARSTLRHRGVYQAWSEAAFDAFLESGLVDAGIRGTDSTDSTSGTDSTVAAGVSLACPPWVEAATYLCRPDQAIFDWAEQVQVPAVILRGRDSDVCQPPAAEDLADALPAGAVLEVAGGHTFPQEHPAEAGAVLETALDLIGRPVGASPLEQAQQ